MNTKHVVALYGPANVGKSSILRRVLTLLTEAYPTALIQIINPRGVEIAITIEVDITVVIQINGTSVGIESQGDPNSRLLESLELFKEAKCSIIACATRTRGRTVEAVNSLCPEFTLTWHRKQSEPQASLRDQGDHASAQTIFNEIQHALNNP